MESLVCDIPAGDGKINTFFYSVDFKFTDRNTDPKVQNISLNFYLLLFL